MKSPFVKPLSRSSAESAAEILGVDLDEVSRMDVVGAFRKLVRVYHPDTGAPNAEAAEALGVAFAARDVLLRWVDERPKKNCPLCKGSGSLRSGLFTTRTCPECGGV